MAIKRKYPIGAEVTPKGVHFRVWAPDHKKVDLVIENHFSFILPMKKEKHGFFSLLTKKAKPGTLYRYRLSNSRMCADPASRFQPKGPVGPSCVINPKFNWTDKKWKGVGNKNQIIYEMHIGTFTEKGTYEAAAEELEYLSELGITIIELMPLADFPGYFGWGYDGVNLYAPCRLYGTPDQLKAFIDKAHALGIGVILDVVYNHLGPEHNHLIHFADEYLSSKFATDWGKGINFDSPYSREFFLTNAKYWIEEFHFDGLRIDATPWIRSTTPVHILKDLARITKASGGKRKKIVIGENESQNTKLLRGYGFDMLWNDDFHHSAVVRLTGNREAYFTDYHGRAQEFISLLKYGYLYQGQYYDWQQKNRGSPSLDLASHSFVVFLENHDQIANSGNGKRIHQRSNPGDFKALTALFLLAPQTPLIFQGQEFNSTKPFCYFADHSPPMAELVKKGRKKELAQFPRLATKQAQKNLSDPHSPLTFSMCKLDHGERVKNSQNLQLYKDLIYLKRYDPVFSTIDNSEIDGAVINEHSFIIRFFNKKEGDRLLIINFGSDFYFNPAPEPLLAPEAKKVFKILWSSEDVIYGGVGTPILNDPHYKILAHSAVVFQSVPLHEGRA